MNSEGRLYVISGPSGVGKATVIKEFLKRHKDINLSISCTTRQPRKGEIDGIDYFFISKEEFKENIKNSEFIEWAEFNNNLYGTKREYVKKILSSGKHLILEIDTNGAFQIKEKIKDAILIFIEPPDKETLRKRLYGRGTDAPDVIESRLQIALNELKKISAFDYSVVNDNLTDAVFKLETIIEHTGK